MLVLASASPRRAELLRKAGIDFQVKPSHVPEVPKPGESPIAYARRLAADKALAVVGQVENAFVLGADTIVIVDRHILEKPSNPADARRMLQLLSGRTHQVTTGVCLVNPRRSSPDIRSETTEVTFANLSENEIDFYVSSGEPMDKAGAYAIQGLASRWIVGVSGCFFNVVGLPIPLVYRMLVEHGAI